MQGFNTRVAKQQERSVECGTVLRASTAHDKKAPADLFDMADPEPIHMSFACSYNLCAKGVFRKEKRRRSIGSESTCNAASCGCIFIL